MNENKVTDPVEGQEEYNRLAAERQRRRAEVQKRQVRNQRLGFAAIGLILILLILLIARGCSKVRSNKETPPVDSSAESMQESELSIEPEPEPEPEEPVPTTTSFSLTSVGDIMIYDAQISAAEKSGGIYDFSPCFSRVSSYLSSADITTANLETTFSDGYAYGGASPLFNAPVELAEDLASTGFDLLSTANTYSILYGISGLQSTIEHIRSAGMKNVGTFLTQEERDTDGGAQFFEVNGIKVAFLAYTKNVNDMFMPDGSEYAVNLLYEDYYDTYDGILEDVLLADVQAAKDAGADVIIVLPHWGSEYVFTTRSTQEEIADLLFANGVDAIIGCHSHVVNAMETRTVTTVDGEEKEVFIAYGLGNFLSSMDREYTRETVILNLTFTKDIETGETTLDDVNYIPCYILDTGEDGPSRYQVVSIHDEITAYLTAGSSDAVDDETYTVLTEALDSIRGHAGAEFDIDPTGQVDPLSSVDDTSEAPPTDETADDLEDGDAVPAEDPTQDSAEA